MVSRVNGMTQIGGRYSGMASWGAKAVGAVCQELWPSIHQDSACQFSF